MTPYGLELSSDLTPRSLSAHRECSVLPNPLLNQGFASNCIYCCVSPGIGHTTRYQLLPSSPGSCLGSTWKGVGCKSQGPAHRHAVG